MAELDRTTAPPQTIRLADYTPPDFVIDTVELIFELDEDGATVKSRLSISRDGDAAAPLRLDGEALELVSIALDGEPLGANRYRIEPEALVIGDVPDAFVLDIETRIHPQSNTTLSGLYTSGGNFTTQCEPEGFRRITYFIDRPDVMARFSTTIVADKTRYPVLLSNGNPVDTGESVGGKHWAKWDDPHPKPSYLFALIAGDLIAVRDAFVTASGRTVPLAIWVRRGDEDRCFHAMQALKDAMRWDEEKFGREYDLDVFNIVAVSDFNMGAMENKGLNIFNTRFILAKPETATDIDFQGIERVVAHEYFHNWTGNRVTCRDWFQLSLKEGLTVYRDQEFMSDQHSRPVKRISDVRVLRSAQFPEDDGPLAHPVRPDSYIEIDNFYTATVYEKGAEIVRMVRTLVGESGFRQGMDCYFERHDNQAVTVEDFVAAIADGSGVDLSGVMQWYRQAGAPQITLEDSYDPATHTYDLTLSQTIKPTPGQPEKSPQLVPVAVGLISQSGAPLAFRLDDETTPDSATRVLRFIDAVQRFRFHDVAEAPVPSILRGFSAPVRLANMPLDRLKLLARYDSDPFGRWDAGQKLATQVLLDLAATWRQGGALALDPDLVEAWRSTLAQSDSDPAFAAEALSLPGETVLGDEAPVVDVEAVHAARLFTRIEIGRSLAADFSATYERLTDHGPFRVDGRAMGQRALRNLSLSYLTAGGDPSALALAKAQFDAGGSMTDVLAALSVLNEFDIPERAEALAAFYDRFTGNDLVIDKWFAVQGMSSLPDALERVEELARHPAFDRRNPNRVRSLIVSFSQSNPLRFHAADGGGYHFLADHVMALDPLNPQIAARLVQPLGRWRRHDATRQGLMRQALERVLAAPDLSKNTFEMASKSLG